uniref:Putative clathrin assembly protein n=1 Tax=Aegilops tauschii TaxID=37682 RepID=M8BN40_AEGTA
MQSWRKAYGAIKDTTTVSLANINSDFKDLDVAIVKATNHVECPPKERHLRKIAAATSIARPRADIAYCIHALSRRLSKTRNWIVALKTLVVVHRLLREGDPTFREELLNFTQRGRILQLSNFKDDSSPIAWDCSAWVRTYGQFLEERLECFRILKYDVEAERLSKQGQGPEKPEGAANNNYLVQYALALVLKESFKIYCAINDGIINLVDKFFEMARHEALKALEIYRRAGQQAGNLSDFYENCRGLELARNFQFPTLREEFPERLLLTYKPEESEEVPEPDPVEEERPPVEEPVPVQPIPEVVSPPTKPVVADTGDLLGLNDPSPGVSAIEESNALALAIVTSDASTSTTGSTAWQDKGFDPTGWELALVTAPSNTNSSATDSQLVGFSTFAILFFSEDIYPVDSFGLLVTVNRSKGGGLDKLILDSLYDEGAYRQSQQQQLYGSSAPNPFMTSDPFAMSNHVAAPSSVQMAAMSQQQQQIPTMIHQNPFGPPIQPQHPGAGPAAVNPFLDSGFGAFPAANNSQQQANPFGGSLL